MAKKVSIDEALKAWKKMQRNTTKINCVSTVDSKNKNKVSKKTKYERKLPPDSKMKASSLEQTGKFHKCNVCFAEFKTPVNLNAHYRIHTGEKPYPCKVCGKFFRQNSQRRVHERIHTDERPYACELCPKTFRQMVHRNRHMQSHTGFKMNKCSICERQFINSWNLKQHIVKIHLTK